MPFPRASGILLHPTSLPSRFGIGDLGKTAYEFVDFLEKSGQTLWQILPLGPTGYGNSPYMSYSAIAGNPLLISPESLTASGLLAESDLDPMPPFPKGFVNFELVIPYKNRLLRLAYDRFQQNQVPEQNAAFASFCDREAAWLDDYALFMALLEASPESTWNRWEADIARREPAAIAAKREELQAAIAFHQFQQFLFFEQWQKLRTYANEVGIQIVGDIPIYVAHNSADVWSNPDNFKLDPETLEVAMMAGVPPDYFSATGQLWGNPVYNWEYLEASDFAWWIARFRLMTKLVDLIRIDHFRGFEAFWQVAAGEETAIHGEWETAPGTALFEKLREELGSLPILAEDLGLITPEVEELRDRFEFPGMRVLMFAFGGGADNFHLPHHHVQNALVYTGTHDNDTAVGWWLRAEAWEQQLLRRYLGLSPKDANHQEPIREIHWLLIRLAFGSVANQAIVPLQDLLGLDNSARMNVPGTATGNWAWRYDRSEDLSDDLAERLLDLTELYSRKRPAIARQELTTAEETATQ